MQKPKGKDKFPNFEFQKISFSYKQSLLTLPSYIYEQPHIYSLNDLVKVNRSFFVFIRLCFLKA